MKPSCIPSGLAVAVASITMTLGLSRADVLPGARPQAWPANPSRHQVVIARGAKTDAEQRLLATAEAAVPAPAEVARAFAEEPGNKNHPQPADQNRYSPR